MGDTELKRNPDGSFIVDQKSILEALNELESLYHKINTLSDLKDDYSALSKSIAEFMDKNDIKSRYGKFIKFKLVQRYKSFWVWDESDMPEDGVNAVPLKTLLPKALWNKVTKRVVDGKAVDQLVKSGEIDLDDIAPAYVHQKQSVYLRISEINEKDESDY